MVTGQHFRLSVETLGIEVITDDNRVGVKVPAGETKRRPRPPKGTGKANLRVPT